MTPTDSRHSESRRRDPVDFGHSHSRDARPLRHRDESAYLERLEDPSNNNGAVKMHRCPICGLRREEWDTTNTAKHLNREDHTWKALDAVAERHRTRHLSTTTEAATTVDELTPRVVTDGGETAAPRE